MNAGTALTATLKHLETAGWVDFDNMHSEPVNYGQHYYIHGYAWKNGQRHDISVTVTPHQTDVILGEVTVHDDDPFQGIAGVKHDQTGTE